MKILMNLKKEGSLKSKKKKKELCVKREHLRMILIYFTKILTWKNILTESFQLRIKEFRINMKN